MKFSHFLIAEINDQFEGCLLKLAEIKEYEDENPDAEPNLDQDELDENPADQSVSEGRYNEAVRYAPSIMSLTRLALKLLCITSSDPKCQEAYVNEQIVIAFTQALNFVLNQLVSDRNKKIKVNTI